MVESTPTTLAEGDYRERRPTPYLAARVACVWGSRHSGPVRIKPIVPDGCIDLIWSSHDGRVHVAGPDTGPFPAQLRPAEEFAGVRLRPGAAAAVLGVPASALRDARVWLGDLWTGEAARFADTVAAAVDRPRALESLIAQRVLDAGPRDRAIVGVVKALATGVGVHDLAAQLGYSERHLLRRCREEFGYGPKILHRVLRFQRALRAIDSGMPLAEVAHRCGYSDQAHLTREVRNLGGAPPSARV